MTSDPVPARAREGHPGVRGTGRSESQGQRIGVKSLPTTTKAKTGAGGLGLSLEPCVVFLSSGSAQTVPVEASMSSVLKESLDG